MLLATIDARRFVPVRISTPFPGCNEYNVGMCVIGYGYHTGGVRGRTVGGGEGLALRTPPTPRSLRR
jgi:hypothetical protein